MRLSKAARSLQADPVVSLKPTLYATDYMQAPEQGMPLES